LEPGGNPSRRGAGRAGNRVHAVELDVVRVEHGHRVKTSRHVSIHVELSQNYDVEPVALEQVRRSLRRRRVVEVLRLEGATRGEGGEQTKITQWGARPKRRQDDLVAKVPELSEVCRRRFAADDEAEQRDAPAPLAQLAH